MDDTSEKKSKRVVKQVGSISTFDINDKHVPYFILPLFLSSNKEYGKDNEHRFSLAIIACLVILFVRADDDVPLYYTCRV